MTLPAGEEKAHTNASWMLVGLVYMMRVMYVAAAESLTQERHRGAAPDLSVDCLKELHPSDCLHLLAQTKVIYLHIYEPINKVSLRIYPGIQLSVTIAVCTFIG